MPAEHALSPLCALLKAYLRAPRSVATTCCRCSGVASAGSIGSPTARDTFDDNTWLYISELTRERIGRTLGELNQNVVVINFNEKGVLTNVHELDKADALPVKVIARTTPSPGTEASFMQQLLGNIGRFNPAGIVPTGGTGASGGGFGGSPAQ